MWAKGVGGNISARLVFTSDNEMARLGIFRSDARCLGASTRWRSLNI
jgi:hypothetical protein